MSLIHVDRAAFAKLDLSPEKLELLSLLDRIDMSGQWQLIGMAKALALECPAQKNSGTIISFPFQEGVK